MNDHSMDSEHMIYSKTGSISIPFGNSSFTTNASRNSYNNSAIKKVENLPFYGINLLFLIVEQNFI